MPKKPIYFSNPELASFARKAGFPEELIPTMVGISKAESGGNPLAFNPNASTGDLSYGLMQINMLGGMGPERRKEFGIKANEELYDPLKNFQAAKKIYDQQGLGAWSVYRSGKYKDFLPTGAQINQTGTQAFNQSLVDPDRPYSNTTTATTADGIPININISLGDSKKTEERKSIADIMSNNLLNQVLQQRPLIDPMTLFQQMGAMFQ
jgi:hypothetical protein